MFRWGLIGLVALVGCGGGDPAPEGYERWTGAGATFVYPEGWEEEDRPDEFKAAGVKFVAGSESARVLVLEDTGQDIFAFMSDTLGSPEWLNYDLRLRRRERIDVPGAEGAFRREATARDTDLTFVFASHNPRSHVALAVATAKGAAADVDADAILRSLALD
jgi:hypothetical protein